MRRHLIVGRFGPLDKAVVPSAADEQVTKLDLLSGENRLGHGLGAAIEDLVSIGLFPTETGLDLAVLAALVQAADTRIARVTESQDSWTREIRLVIPVSGIEHWNAASGTIVAMLNFLTGDRWTVGFRPRPKKHSTLVPRLPANPPESGFDDVALFSGGLDSLIGAIDLLEARKKPLFVSHAGEGTVSKAQDTCFGLLRDEYKGIAMKRLRVWMLFDQGVVAKVKGENTTRGRSFLFIALGVFAATGLRKSFTLYIPENGLIALNPPLDALRLGSLSTRTTHPFFLGCWNRLLNVLGVPGTVVDPYSAATKGEMIAGCRNPNLLRRVLPRSLSCASATKGRWKGLPPQHCGYCLPCLIRRAAVQSAWGRGKDRTTYTLDDLEAAPLDPLKAEGEAARSLQLAARRLQSEPDLAKIMIHKQGPLGSNPTELAAWAGVYRRGMAEIAGLLDRVKTRS